MAVLLNRSGHLTPTPAVEQHLCRPDQTVDSAFIPDTNSHVGVSILGPTGKNTKNVVGNYIETNTQGGSAGDQ